MYSKREVYICACIGKCLHARIIFSFHKNNITDLDKIISWHIIGQNVVSSFCNWGMSSSSTSAVSGRAGIRSPSEPDRTPVFKQKLKSDSNWVQSLRSSNYSQPYLTSSVSRKYTEDLSEVDQLLLEGKVLRKVQSTVRKNSWNQSLKILMEQEKSMQETDNTTPRLLRKKGTAKLQDGNGISENFEPSGFQSPALQKFDEHEYQAFAKSVQSGRVSQNLKKELQSATGSARSPMQNNKHGSRSLSSLSATFAPPVLPGVDIISEHATHKKRDLTFMSHGSGAIYDAAIHVLNGKSSSVKNRELKAQYLRPNSTVEAMQSLVNGAVTGRKQSSISDSDATDGGTTTLPSAVLKHSATKQPRLTSSPPRSRHLASTSARAHSTPLSLTSANDFDIRLLASSSAVKRPQSANALLSSSRTSPHSVGDITGTYSGPSSPSKVTVQALRGNAQAKSSTMTVQSPDAVFVAPKFTLAQRAALDGRKAKSANLARAATAAQTRGRNIVGNGQGKSGVSMGSINLMRSLENIRHLEASHKEHALREPQSLVSSSRNPNIRLISSAHQKPSKNSAVARISSKLDTELRTPSNDISGRALQVVLHSKGLSPHSLMLPKASTNDKNNGIPHFRDRNREAAEDRLFSRRQFVPPPFSHAVDATHKRLYKKAQENMAKHSIGHGLQTPYVDSNDNLKPSVMMRSMDPDNNTENRNPVEANLLDRSLRLAHSNVSLDKISEGRHPGRPRRGKTLRNSPRQLEFAHQTNNSTYQSPASRRYLNQEKNKKHHFSQIASSNFSSSNNSQKNIKLTPSHVHGGPADDIRALHRRTLELDKMARKLEQDRERLEKEREDIFNLQQNLIQSHDKDWNDDSSIHGVERSVPTSSLSSLRGYNNSHQNQQFDSQLSTRPLPGSVAHHEDFLNGNYSLHDEKMESINGHLTHSALGTDDMSIRDNFENNLGNLREKVDRDLHGNAGISEDNNTETTLDEAFRIIAEKRKKRIQKLQELNKSATDFLDQ